MVTSGWGRSVTRSQERGRTGSTTQVLSDLTSVIKSHLPCSVPLFLMGHSMGGAIVLTYAALGPLEVRRHITGYVAESPWIAIHPSSAPYRITVRVGKVAAKVLPNFQLVQKLDSKWIARDPQIGKDFDRDELCHDTGTLEGFASMLERAADLLSGKIRLVDDEEDGEPRSEAAKPPVRLLVAHGSEDRVTSFEATKQFLNHVKVKDLTFKVYEGWYHKRKYRIFYRVQPYTWPGSCHDRSSSELRSASPSNDLSAVVFPCFQTS